MKTLFLLRHAKSGWKDAGMRDFDRPLIARGKKATSAMGRYMRENDLRPTLIISSPAERAKETVERFMEGGRLTSELRFDERIYDASVERLFEIVTQIDEQADSCLMVGHNPGFEELVQHLTGQQETMPTAALAEIRLDVDKWRQVRPGSGKLERFVRPKELDE
jgi:phosphohistidine phosphatase